MRDIEEALLALKADGARPGKAWQKAHELAQSHEGTPAYDRLHALLHRVEGDEPNAGYWYRRAGDAVFEGDVNEEIDLLIGRSR